jgi:hypothetical protein
MAAALPIQPIAPAAVLPGLAPPAVPHRFAAIILPGADNTKDYVAVAFDAAIITGLPQLGWLDSSAVIAGTRAAPRLSIAGLVGLPAFLYIYTTVRANSSFEFPPKTQPSRGFRFLKNRTAYFCNYLPEPSGGFRKGCGRGKKALFSMADLVLPENPQVCPCTRI